MKRAILWITFYCLFGVFGTSSGVKAFELPDLSALAFTGTLNVTGSFAEVSGNVQDFHVQQLMLPGLDYAYVADLELDGQVGDFYLESYLHFSTTDQPSLELLLESPEWRLESSTFELNLPALQSSFGKQLLTGVHLSRINDTIHLFHGTKAYQSRHAAFTVSDESRLVYTLFDTTAGDMVENSEIVFLQGKRLARYVDYKINFLSGELKLLIPLRAGSLIEVHYNYIPTGLPVKDSLTGGYYQANFGHSSASVFYFDDISITPPDLLAPPDTADTVREHRYAGTAVNIVSGAVQLSGELACTLADTETTDYGGNIHLVYATPDIEVDYQLTTATPGYQGVGVVPVSAGETQTLNGQYTFTPTSYLDWKLSRAKKSTSWSDTLTQIAETAAHYQIADRHWVFVSFDTTALIEWGETTSASDLQAGWQYTISEHASLTYENSLHYPAKNRLTFDWNTYPLRLQSKYQQYPEHLPFEGEYWVRELNTDWIWRPYSGISLTGDIDYWQPFTDPVQNSRRRLALTLLAMPSGKLSMLGSYIYYYNPAVHSRTLFYDLASTLELPFDLQLDSTAERIEIRSPVLSNTDQGWSGTLTRPINEAWKTSLNLTQDEKKVYLESLNAIYQHDNTFQRTLSTTYQITEPLTLTASISDLHELHFLGDTTSTTTEARLSLAAKYALDQNIGQYELTYLRKSGTYQLKHQVNWSNHPGNWLYDYTGELTHLTDYWKLLHAKQMLKLSWQNEACPYQPSLQLSYAKKDDEEQQWESFTASTRCTYKFTQAHLIFVELGHSGNIRYTEPGKSYWGTFLKTGMEYSF